MVSIFKMLSFELKIVSFIFKAKKPYYGWTEGELRKMVFVKAITVNKRGPGQRSNSWSGSGMAQWLERWTRD